MAQTLDQIMAQLAPTYDPQMKIIQAQQADLPGQQAADAAALDTAKTNSFQDITNAANSRGMLYSGMPINEQSRYIGEKYLPAVAAMKNDYTARGYKLADALAGITREKYTTAQSIQNAQTTAESKAAADNAKAAADAASANSWSSILGGAANKTTASTAPTIADNFNADMSTLLNNYQQRFLPGYTERTVIPKLIQLYPELNPADIKNMVYTYRKQNYGE